MAGSINPQIETMNATQIGIINSGLTEKAQQKTRWLVLNDRFAPPTSIGLVAQYLPDINNVMTVINGEAIDPTKNPITLPARPMNITSLVLAVMTM